MRLHLDVQLAPDREEIYSGSFMGSQLLGETNCHNKGLLNTKRSRLFHYDILLFAILTVEKPLLNAL